MNSSSTPTARWRLFLTRRLPLALVGCLLATMAWPADGRQQATAGGPAFEVASVREQERPAFRRPVFSPLPGGRFQALNATVSDLVAYAYGLNSSDIVQGASSWATSAKFDVTAKAGQEWPPGELRQELVRRMLQQLLAERFNLIVRRSKRTQPGFALVPARKDGRLGPQVARSDVDCEELEAARMARIADGGEVSAPENQPGQCNIITNNGVTRFVGHNMGDVARFVSARMREIVVDRTGIRGAYRMELTAAPAFVPETVKTEMLAKGIEFTQPPLEVALQEQLGLKLEKTSIEVDEVVIERVDAPTPN
jgi:uncharacterized protein (TIGR03435 family)